MNERVQSIATQKVTRYVSALLALCLVALCLAVLPKPAGAATASSDPQWASADFTVSGLPVNLNVDVKSVSCVTTTCFSVGTFLDEDYFLHAFAAVSDGSAWTGRQLTGIPENDGEYPQSISCSSLTSCVVVGYSSFEGSSDPFAFVYDGTTWNKASFSLPSGVTKVALKSVSCTSSTFCAVAGYGYDASSVISSVVSVYDGQSWLSTALDRDPSGNGEQLTSISCASSTWCVAVDHSSDAQYTPHPLAVAYDGQSWTKVDLSSLTASASGGFHSVSCLTSTSCSAFGSYQDSNAKSHFFVATYDGQSWTESDLPDLQSPKMAFPLSISCSSSKFCVAAGWLFTASYKMVSVAWVFDGQTWTAVDVTALSAFPQLDGLSCTATSCTGIGKYIDAQYQGHLMTVTVTVPTSGPQLSIVAGNGQRGVPTPGPATASSLWGGQGLATDDAGNLYIADDNAHVIEKVDPSGNLTVVAGTGNLGTPTAGPALSSDFSNLCGIAIDHSGNIFVSDAGNKVVEKIDAQGVLSIYAGMVGSEGSPTPGPAISSSLRNPQGLAVDVSGNLYIADNDSYVVEKVDTNGTLSIVAGTGNYGYPSPGPATSSALKPIGVTVDPSGNLYIADQLNNVVEKVDSFGTLSIFAGKKDPDREVCYGPFCFTLGGMNYGSETPGPATSSFLQQPNSVAVDAAGNVFIADAGNHVVSKVDTAGNLSIVAGTGNGGSPIDSDGDPLATNLENPNGVILDASGNLFIVDAANQYVVKVTQIGSVAPALLSSSVSISNLPLSGAYGGSFTPTISTTGDGSTSVTSSTADVCTVTSSTVNFVGVGTCSLVAHVAKGARYASADGAEQSFLVTATKPSAPGAPALTDNHGSFGLTWAQPLVLGDLSVTYSVYVSTNGGVFVQTATGLTTTSFTYQGTTGYNTYAFRVRASNTAGSGAVSAYSWLQARPIAPSVPGAPVLTDNHGTIGLTWSASSNSGGAPVTYSVAVRTNEGTWLPVASGLTTPSCTFVGSLAGNTYTFEVLASNVSGASAWSQTTSIVATAVKASAPSKPVLTARHGLIQATWSAPADLGGGSVTYNVRVKTNSGRWRQLATGLKGRSFTLFNTWAANSYSFAVSAVNLAGEGPWSLTATKKAV